MAADHREELSRIRTFPSLVKYLRDELDWPITQDSFEEDDDLFYDFTAEELGLDAKTAAKIQEIKRLRPLSAKQPWGIFFIKFEPKKLPVVALRRLLGQVALKKRASANSAERTAWSADDLLFVSNYGEGDTRQISFAHFSQHAAKKDLPTLKVLGWDNLDTALHLDRVAELLNERLAWPENEDDVAAWRRQWCSAFTLRHREVIDTSKKLSVELAVLARNIRDRINTVLAIETERGSVSKLMAAFKEALVHDLDEDGFADMYAQTIAYGLLSARVANPSGDTADDFVGAMPVTNPFLKELMETFLAAGGRTGKAGEGPGLDFDELGVNDIVELLDLANMEAVVRDFGDRNPKEDPVIHFYELFLKEYDAKKRMQRGVFYTPRPVVSFIVRSIHERLRSDFGLDDGFADTTTWGEMAQRINDLSIPDGVTPDQAFVQILDPATGTGTFLVEVIRLVHKTMTEKWQAKGYATKKIDQLWNDYVPRHLLSRLHGYELMMAPYAIAHMKIGLKLYETGYRFESNERAKVYLTNALEPAHDFSGTLAFAIPALAHESEAVNAIKRDQRFTVVMGNPPYSGESANKIESVERDVKATYQSIDGIPIREKGKKNWLLDDYVKFLRESHKAISTTGFGFIGLITNNAYQDNPTFRGLRHSLVSEFSSIAILDLHGSGKRSDPTGQPRVDENVFDILQGVAIVFLGLGVPTQKAAAVTRGDVWGPRASKYSRLETGSPAEMICDSVLPKAPQWYFIPLDLTYEDEWSSHFGLLDAFPINGNGLISAKDHFAYQISADDLRRDLGVFLDSEVSDKQVADRLGIKDNSMWSLHDGRIRFRREHNEDQFCVVSYRPFDTRHSVFHRDVIFNLRLPVTQHIVSGENLALLTTRMTKGARWQHCFVTRAVSDCAFLSNKTSTNAFMFPLMRKEHAGDIFTTGRDEIVPNLAPQFLTRLGHTLGLSSSSDSHHPSTESIFFYIYAVLHSPIYRDRYAEFLKLDFPRIPLASSLELFAALSAMGSDLVSLHLGESANLSHHLTTLVGTGRFQVEKVSYSDNTVWIDKARTRGFHGVPEEVWSFHIGSYQVCEKWLKDRQAKGGKKPRPGRTLTAEDIDHYQKVIVALSETIRITGEIDAVIAVYGGWPDAFDSGATLGREEPEQLAMVAEPEPTYGD